FFLRKDTAAALLIQGDGKIVAAGFARNPAVHVPQFALARYNDDGSLDASFGTGGKVSTGVLGLDDEIFALAIPSDGQIVAGGYALVGGLNCDFALARCSGADGCLDASFGTAGIVLTDFAGGDDEIASVVIRADGKIVAGGLSLGAGSSYDFALARYNAV